VIGSIGEATFPGHVFQEFVDMFNGYGRYRNRSAPEKVWEMLKADVPLMKPVLAWAAAVGLGGKDQEFEAADSVYWKWAREEHPKGAFTLSERVETPEKKAFGIWMRRAGERALVGDVVGVSEAIDAATTEGGADTESIKASLRYQIRLGSDFSENTPHGQAARASLRKRIGERAYQAILRRDGILKELIARL